MVLLFLLLSSDNVSSLFWPYSVLPHITSFVIVMSQKKDKNIQRIYLTSRAYTHYTYFDKKIKTHFDKNIFFLQNIVMTFQNI